MNAIIKELSPDSAAVVFFLNEGLFANIHARESIAEQMRIISKQLEKICIALPVGSDMEELSDDQLKAVGLMRIKSVETTETVEGNQDESTMP